MRILFISASPLKKEISVGNTFLNLFSGMEDMEFASIYTRAGKPDAAIHQGFCMTEKMLLKNLLGKGPAGVKIKPQTMEGTTLSTSEEKKISFMKSRRWTIFFWIQDLIWRIGRWRSKELEDFVEDFKPDIIFTLFSSTSFLNRIILHIKEIAKVPLVVYTWDNNYSIKRVMVSPLKWLHHCMNRCPMRKVAKKADLLYAISNVQKTDYEKAFRKECTVLTKGADFTGNIPVNTELNRPLQLLYTGNIALNRWKSLAHIANVLEKINQNEAKVQLRIYTGNTVTEKMRTMLQRGESSFLMGSVSADEVVKLQQNADILVHVEAMDLKNRLLVRQSFSTKLVDYFHQAKCVFAVGPKEVASMDYLIKNDAAVTATNEKEIEEKLRSLIENPGMVREYGDKAWECGKKHHQIERIQDMLKKDF